MTREEKSKVIKRLTAELAEIPTVTLQMAVPNNIFQPTRTKGNLEAVLRLKKKKKKQKKSTTKYI